MTDSKRAAAALPSLPTEGRFTIVNKIDLALSFDAYPAEVVEQIRRETVMACAAIVETQQIACNWNEREGLAWVLRALLKSDSVNPVSALRVAVAPGPDLAPEWLPIASAPKDAYVLLFVEVAIGDPLIVQGCWYSDPDEGEEGWIDADGDVLPVSHWMPLPPAPTCVSGDQKPNRTEPEPVSSSTGAAPKGDA